MAIWKVSVKIDGEKKQRHFVVDGAESNTEATTIVYEKLNGVGNDFEIVGVNKTNYSEVITVDTE